MKQYLIRTKANLSIVFWLLAAGIAAATTQNFSVSDSNTLWFSGALALCALAIAFTTAALPNMLARIVLVGTMVLCFDSVGQFSVLLNNFVADLTPSSALRHLINLTALTGMIAAGVYFLGRNLKRFLFVGGLLLLVSIIGFPQLDRNLGWQGSRSEKGELGRAVIHLILDEHTGPAGLQAGASNEESAQALKSFFADNGFKIFANAYSAYNYTEYSFPTFLSLEKPGSVFETPEKLLSKWRTPMPWFTRLHDDGFRLNVFSVGTSWNLCVDALRSIVASCTIAGDRAITSDKNMIIPSSSIESIKAGFSLLSTRTVFLSVPAERLGLTTEIRGQGPAHALMVTDRIAGEIKNASGDTAWIAHLWVPHSPFVVDANCQPKSAPAKGDERAYWTAYEAQIFCFRRGVLPIIEALDKRGALDRSTIIVQGDHGLRPSKPGYDILRWRTITHSSLFALRAPGLAAGTSDCFHTIQELLRTATYGGTAAIGDGIVQDVVDPNFWLEDAGRRRPDLKSVELPAKPVACSNLSELPRLLSKTHR